ncbi:MAG: hypothetical protein ACE5OZ_18780 [Candidatus Heimdallarchaeota archaeon]
MTSLHFSVIHQKTDAKPCFADEDTFESGETYFERLFDTLHLYQAAYQRIRCEPGNRAEILKEYSTKVRTYLKVHEE